MMPDGNFDILGFLGLQPYHMNIIFCEQVIRWDDWWLHTFFRLALLALFDCLCLPSLICSDCVFVMNKANIDLNGSWLSNLDQTKMYQCNAEKTVNGTAGASFITMTVRNLRLEAFHNTTSPCEFDNKCKCYTEVFTFVAD
jgi:hypothetical protein